MVRTFIPGNYCVVLYKGNWLRAEIIKKTTDDMVKVYFVDFGTIDVVPMSQCREMFTNVFKIPKQCYCGSLEFVEPIANREIEREVTGSFCEMVRNVPLVGVIMKVNQTVSFFFRFLNSLLTAFTTQ